MSTNAIAGQGSQLKRGDGHSPELFVAIAEITRIQQSGKKADFEDATNMDSSGAYREYVPTFLDSGEVSFDANLIAADNTQGLVLSDFNSRRKGNWQITLPGSLGHWAFEAYVSGFDVDDSFDKIVRISGKLKVTGPVVFTPGS